MPDRYVSGRNHPLQVLIQIDTSNILFICGGAFDGLEKIIENRIGKKSLGFESDLAENANLDKGNIFSHTTPADLLKFGLIPEFIGRLPLIASLEMLDEEALVKIFKEPKNSLLKQYTKMLGFDGVELEFEDAAIREVARETIEKKTGARGLRSIIEEIMLDIMYEVPSDEEIEKCIITYDTVKNRKGATIVRKEKKKDLTA